MILHLRIVSGPVLPPEPLPTHGPLATTSATRVTEGFSAPVPFALPTSEPVSTRPPPPQAIPQLLPQSAPALQPVPMPALQPAPGPQAGPAPSPGRPATQALFGFPVPPCKSDLRYIYTLNISKCTKYWMYFDRTTVANITSMLQGTMFHGFPISCQLFREISRYHKPTDFSLLVKLFSPGKVS